MYATAAKRGFALIDLLVTTAIVVILMALALPAVQASREVERRQMCLNNVHMIGLAMWNYASVHGNAFPAAASLTKAGGGNKKFVGGYSFLGA